jgi:hypothetical protein
MVRRSFVAVVAVAAIAWNSSACAAENGTFALYEGIDLPIEVFVADPHAPIAVGGERVLHVAGVRRPDASDPETTELVSADADHLQVTLGEWREARGSYALEVSPRGATQLVAQFDGLVAFGSYSLFAQAQETNAPLLPLDGGGTKNGFHADTNGKARIAVPLPGALVAGTHVVLVFHSDGADHGRSPGDLTRDAHIQLAATITS